MNSLFTTRQQLSRQNGIILNSQMSNEERLAALDAGVLCSVFGEHGDLEIAGETILRAADEGLDGYIEAYYAPLLVATYQAHHPAVIIWEAALEIQNLGVLPTHPERGIDVAINPKDTHRVRNLPDPHRLTTHNMTLESTDWIEYDGIPVQRTDKAIRFLADDSGVEMQWIEAAVTDAFHDGLATLDQLAAAVDNRARHEPIPTTGEDLVSQWIPSTAVVF